MAEARRGVGGEEGGGERVHFQESFFAHTSDALGLTGLFLHVVSHPLGSFHVAWDYQSTMGSGWLQFLYDSWLPEENADAARLLKGLSLVWTQRRLCCILLFCW